MAEKLHPIDPGTLAVIELTAHKTAKAVVDEHRENCPITEVRADLYGNGRRGIKGDVRECLSELSSFRRSRSWWAGALRTVVAAVAVAVILWLLGFRPGPTARAERPPGSSTESTERRSER